MHERDQNYIQRDQITVSNLLEPKQDRQNKTAEISCKKINKGK